MTRSAQIIPFPSATSQAVFNAIREAVEKHLHYLFEGLAANAGDALFEEMWSLDRQEALRRQFNVMRFLKLHVAFYGAEFDERMTPVWEGMINGTAVDLEIPGGPAADYIDANARRIERHYRVLICELNDSFRDHMRITPEDFPLNPGNFYRAFWLGIENAGLTYDERYSLLVMFHRFVMDRYGQVLARISCALSDHDDRIMNR